MQKLQSALGALRSTLLPEALPAATVRAANLMKGCDVVRNDADPAEPALTFQR
jgi:hypothetical protein